MNIKIRLAISLLIALSGTIVSYILTANASEHTNITTILMMPLISLFLATLAITSLFNIKNESSRKKYLIIIGIIIIINIYGQYGQGRSLAAILGIAYVGASVVALIIRFFILLKEKFYDRLPN